MNKRFEVFKVFTELKVNKKNFFALVDLSINKMRPGAEFIVQMIHECRSINLLL